MKIALLILAIINLHGFEIIVPGYDGDEFKLINSVETNSTESYLIDKLIYENEIVYFSTSVNKSVAVRFGEHKKLFLSFAEDKNNRFIIIGSRKGGIKLVLKLDETMRYNPLDSKQLKENMEIIKIHFIHYNFSHD